MNRIHYMSNILKTVKKNDLKEGIRQFELINDSLFQLTQSLYDGKETIELHRTELEGKYFRYGLANQSIISLIKGNSFTLLTQPTLIADIFSISSLTRMQIESFSIMYYLFFDQEDSNLLKFRYLIYKLHGLQKQSKFDFSTEFSSEKFKIIQKEIKDTQKLISDHELFTEAKVKKKKEFLEPPKAKLLTTYDILVKTNLKSRRFDELWNLYSNHAHSEHISDRQFNTIYKLQKSTQSTCSAAITFNSVLSTKLCKYLIDNFESAEKAYNNFELERQVLIDVWNTKKNENISNFK